MLINCVVYGGGKRLREIAIREIPEWRSHPECFVWVALQDPSHAELAELQEIFGLHDLAIEDVIQQDQRPKIEEYDGTLFAVVHMVDFDGTQVQVGEVNVFVGPGFALSVRSGSPRRSDSSASATLPATRSNPSRHASPRGSPSTPATCR